MVEYEFGEMVYYTSLKKNRRTMGVFIRYEDGDKVLIATRDRARLQKVPRDRVMRKGHNPDRRIYLRIEPIEDELFNYRLEMKIEDRGWHQLDTHISKSDAVVSQKRLETALTALGFRVRCRRERTNGIRP